MTHDAAQFIGMTNSDGTSIVKILDPQVLADEKAALYALADGSAGTHLSSQVVLNLENVHSLKSVMIATLITFQKKIRERGGSLKICCIDPEVMRLFELTRMDQILDLRGDERDAVQSFESSGGWMGRLFGSK
jgi:anti-anti-sigma factor